MSVMRIRAQVLAYALVALAALGSMAFPSASLASDSEEGCKVATNCNFCHCIRNGEQLECECRNCTLECVATQ
jgi:cytochrome c2